MAEVKKPVTRVTHPILTLRNNGDRSGGKPAGGDTCDRFSDLLQKVKVTGDRFYGIDLAYARLCKRHQWLETQNVSPEARPTVIPDWLLKHLETIGAMGPDRIGRAARLHHCKDCGRHILTGLDNDRCAGVAHADPTPLSPLGEALALVGNRRTYTLHQMSGRLELQLRDQWQIEGSPAGTRTDVLPEHTCQAVDLPSAESVHQRYAAVLPVNPPF